MLILLLAGAGVQSPSTDGVRAYATPMFSNAEDGAISLSLVNETTDSVTTTTDAYPTEE